MYDFFHEKCGEYFQTDNSVYFVENALQDEQDYLLTYIKTTSLRQLKRSKSEADVIRMIVKKTIENHFIHSDNESDLTQIIDKPIDIYDGKIELQSIRFYIPSFWRLQNR